MKIKRIRHTYTHGLHVTTIKDETDTEGWPRRSTGFQGCVQDAQYCKE